MTSPPVTAAELRAEVARRRVALYRLAADVGVNPNRLGSMLNERAPLPPEIAARVLHALGVEVPGAELDGEPLKEGDGAL
jgi:hypothetical protein